MYNKIYSNKDKKFVSVFSKKGKEILINYTNHINGGASAIKDEKQMESKMKSDSIDSHILELESLEPRERILRSFEQVYDNTFWVSSHGVYENSNTFKVPIGCKLIFTTWLGKLGEGDNYQENETFRDLQAKNPTQFVNMGAPENKDRPVLPEILQKDNMWGRSDRTLFSHRIIYNEGDDCPDLHMIMDGDCWKQGLFSVPIKKTDKYYVDKLDGDEDCEGYNKNTADFYWKPKMIRVLDNVSRGQIKKKKDGSGSSVLEVGNKIKARIGENTCYHDAIVTAVKENYKYTIRFDKPHEGINPEWESHMSRELGEKIGIDINRKVRFSNGPSDSTNPIVSKRWGAQRSLRNLLTELSNVGIRGIFIIGLCRPDDVSGTTYYDSDNPNILRANNVELSSAEYDNILRLESKQREKNIEYQQIYDNFKTDEQKEIINKLKMRADAGFLENLPHFESDPSLKQYIEFIAKFIYHDYEKKPDDWMEDLLEDKFEKITIPLVNPERVLKNITGKNKLSGTDKRHSSLMLISESDQSKSIRKIIVSNEDARRHAYMEMISKFWKSIKNRIAILLTKSLFTLRRIAKSKNIALKDEFDDSDDDSDEEEDDSGEEEDNSDEEEDNSGEEEDDSDEEEEEETLQDIDLDRKTKKQLLVIAHKYKINIKKGLKKKKILELLEKEQETDKGAFQLAFEIALSEQTLV